LIGTKIGDVNDLNGTVAVITPYFHNTTALGADWVKFTVKQNCSK